MILGFTHNELAWAMKLAQPGTNTSGGTLKKFERSPPPEQATAKRTEMISSVVAAVIAVMDLGLSPGPDFVLPEESPTVIIESKVAEDGGTARDKAARIKNAADAAKDRGLLPCAVVDGKGWSERPHALVDVVIATEGRTHSLDTHLLEIPEIIGLRES